MSPLPRYRDSEMRNVPSPVAAAAGVVFLPVAAVDLGDLHARHGAGIETARVDAVSIGVRARHVERFHAAGGAEQVLRRAGVEGVLGERVPAREQPEAL